MASDTPDRRERDAPDRQVPAFGPVEAVLGYALFFVLFERATPAVREVLSDVLPVSPSAVGFALAAFMWFVLAVMSVDQLVRQLGALGLLEYNGNRRAERWSERIGTAGYVALALVGGVVAVLTVDAGLETAVELVRIVGRLDFAAIDLGALVVMATFFVAYSLATRAVDRLVVRALRRLLSAP